MGEIEQGLERAARTRPLPQSVPARLRHLLRGAGGSTRALAQELGVSQRTVQRWLKGTAQPKPGAARTIERKVRSTWQPGVQRRVRRQAEQQGFTLHVQARFGYTAAGGSTDDPRERHITQYLPGSVAARLYNARDNGAGEREQEQILAEALQEYYFKDNGHRAAGLSAEFTDIAWATIEPH